MNKKFEITLELVCKLISEQFPEWSNLPIRPVAKSGNDNRTFHLGNNMIIRLPSKKEYAPQIEKELKWLPILAKSLPLPIPKPIAQGTPTKYYPFLWSVNHYLEGESANRENISNFQQFAKELSLFLKKLQSIDTKEAPAAGKHNFYRGANPYVYDYQIEPALEELKTELPISKIRTIWKRAISSAWEHPAVWIHGDIAPGNILVKDGKLCGVIDFGIMGIGDPACDYALAWTFLDKESRKIFLDDLEINTIERAKGWALWKALITYHSCNAEVADNAKYTIKAIIEET